MTVVSSAGRGLLPKPQSEQSCSERGIAWQLLLLLLYEVNVLRNSIATTARALPCLLFVRPTRPADVLEVLSDYEVAFEGPAGPEWPAGSAAEGGSSANHGSAGEGNPNWATFYRTRETTELNARFGDLHYKIRDLEVREEACRIIVDVEGAMKDTLMLESRGSAWWRPLGQDSHAVGATGDWRELFASTWGSAF